MKIVPLYEVKNRLSEYVTEAGRRPVIITRNGRPCAAIVSVEGEDIETFLLAHDARFLALLDAAHARADAEGTTSLAAVERELARRERQETGVQPRTRRRLPRRRRRRPGTATR